MGKLSRRELAKIVGRSAFAALLLPFTRIAHAQQTSNPTLVGQTAEALVQNGLPVNIEVDSIYNDVAEGAVYMTCDLLNRSSEVVTSVQIHVAAFNERGQLVAGDFRTIDRLEVPAFGQQTLRTQLSNFLYTPPDGTYRRYVAAVVWGTWASGGWWKESASPADLQQAMRTQTALESYSYVSPQAAPPGPCNIQGYCDDGGSCWAIQQGACCNDHQSLNLTGGSCSSGSGCQCSFTCGGKC